MTRWIAARRQFGRRIAFLAMLAAAGCQGLPSSSPLTGTVSAPRGATPPQPIDVDYEPPGGRTPSGTADSTPAHLAAIDDVEVGQPAEKRGGWSRWLDRFTGPKRHPLPLADEEIGVPAAALADADPFGGP